LDFYIVASKQATTTKMSWQGYVDNLMTTKHMTSCGIFGLDGSPWAVSEGFPVS